MLVLFFETEAGTEKTEDLQNRGRFFFDDFYSRKLSTIFIPGRNVWLETCGRNVGFED